MPSFSAAARVAARISLPVRPVTNSVVSRSCQRFPTARARTNPAGGAVVLTLLIFLALFMPLMNAIGRGDPLAITRVLIMLVATAVAMAFFVKSFVDARKARA